MDARDGFAPNFLTDSDLVNEMVSVDSHAVWSLLDAKGTQMMMKSVLGEASQIADYDTVKNRMKGSRYTMDFSNGVRFDMSVNMSDTITAATCSTLLKGVRCCARRRGLRWRRQHWSRPRSIRVGHADGRATRRRTASLRAC